MAKLHPNPALNSIASHPVSKAALKDQQAEVQPITLRIPSLIIKLANIKTLVKVQSKVKSSLKTEVRLS